MSSFIGRARRRLLRALLFLPAALGFVPAAAQVADTPAPKAILIIGDGMDDQQITIARNYLVGSGGRLALDGLHYRGAAQVQTVAEDDPARPVYLADSANTATTLATGVVTSRGRIATTAQADEDAETILEFAHAAGYGTGIVTTASVTDATPASFVAHVNQRFCQNPAGMQQTIRAFRLTVDCSADYKRNGGQGSIAEQIAASDVDIVLGGGMRHFDRAAEGETGTSVLDLARANGYRILARPGDLARQARGEKVLGLFGPNTLPVRWRGRDGAQAEPIARDESGRLVWPAPFHCENNPDYGDTPSLAAMTEAALAWLDPDVSFMLMVESASIDKQSHFRRPCGHIGELAQLDETVALALDYAEAHPETLIVVTADHSHAAQIIAETSELLAVDVATPGYFARVATPEGGIMGINYGTSTSSQQEVHTGAQVPVFASGRGVSGWPRFVTQADLFRLLVQHLGLAEGS